MMCEACVRHVTEALTAVTGVRQAEVDLKAGRAVVQHEDVDETALVAAVTEADYEATVAG